jgi:hypothetical protein
MAHLEICRRYASLKDGVALVFDGTATLQAALFIDRSEDLLKSRLFELTSRSDGTHKT